MLAIDWHWHITTDVDVGVDDDDVDIDLVLGLVGRDIHLVITLTYLGPDSVWSAALRRHNKKFFLQIIFLFKIKTLNLLALLYESTSTRYKIFFFFKLN
jgi:hypothetical protein